MSMGTRYMMRNAYFCKEGTKLLVFTAPIRLHSKNFSVKLPFNKSLKFMKTLKNFALVAQQIDPSELAEIINKTHIISISSNSWESRAPNIGENKF